jgi:hypothetical protein
MGKALIIFFIISLVWCLNINAESIYVDSITGNDINPGTNDAPVYSIEKAAEVIQNNNNDLYSIKINPGIYILHKYVPVSTKKDMANKRIIIEASILPDDESWSPDKMPVITSKSMRGELPINDNFVVSFLIDESHVTIRGLKFHGYYYPHVRYFPVARFNKAKTDLMVEQCIFSGDANIAQIQAGVIASGNEVKIDHCIFYKIRNTVVFFLDSGDGIKSGNSLTNSIIFGASQAVWTVSPDNDFRFEHNIVSNCRYVWAKNNFNTSNSYSINNCIVVNNKYSKGVADDRRLSPDDFELRENNVTKSGNISLRLTGNNDKPSLDEVDKPLPIDYLHTIPGSLGSDLGAGIFKHKKTP